MDKEKIIKSEPVSKVGVFLFIATLLVIAALIALPFVCAFSLDDIIREVSGFFSACPFCGADINIG